MSITWSATILFSRPFSCSSALSRFSVWSSMPLYCFRHRWYVASLTSSSMQTSAIVAPLLKTVRLPLAASARSVLDCVAFSSSSPFPLQGRWTLILPGSGYAGQARSIRHHRSGPPLRFRRASAERRCALRGRPCWAAMRDWSCRKRSPSAEPDGSPQRRFRSPGPMLAPTLPSMSRTAASSSNGDSSSRSPAWSRHA